jgi:hypothetical protein
VDEQRWAAAHFRVERDSAGVLMRKGQRKKATKQAIEHGDPVPEQPRDIVRIYNRDGDVVFEQDWGSERSAAMAHEARIIDDLLHLDAITFSAKYGIDAPALPPPASPQAGSDRAGDAAAGSEPAGRSEQGSG